MKNSGPGSCCVENMGSGGKHRLWWKPRGLVENTGCGEKHGVWWKTIFGLVWKTRGVLVKNMGEPFFLAKITEMRSRNFVSLNKIALKINSTSYFICETHFSNISCERNSFNHRESSAAVFFGTRCLFFFLFFKYWNNKELFCIVS